MLAVCEAVKLHLGVHGPAFVVGCDRAAVGPNGMLRDVPPEAAEFIPASSPDRLLRWVGRIARQRTSAPAPGIV